MLYMQKMFSIVLPWWLWYNKLHNKYHQNLITLHTTSLVINFQKYGEKNQWIYNKNNNSILFKGNNTMVTYNKKIYIYIEFLASFWRIWTSFVSEAVFTKLYYEALYFDSKRTNIIDNIQNRKSSTKTISLIICNHALQLCLLCIQT
jgi:hypothetical protein